MTLHPCTLSSALTARACEPFVAAVSPRKERGRVIPRLPPGKTQRSGFDGKRRKRGVNELFMRTCR